MFEDSKYLNILEYIFLPLISFKKCEHDLFPWAHSPGFPPGAPNRPHPRGTAASAAWEVRSGPELLMRSRNAPPPPQAHRGHRSRPYSSPGPFLSAVPALPPVFLPARLFLRRVSLPARCCPGLAAGVGQRVARRVPHGHGHPSSPGAAAGKQQQKTHQKNKETHFNLGSESIVKSMCCAACEKLKQRLRRRETLLRLCGRWVNGC